jgi:hypothetical protein
VGGSGHPGRRARAGARRTSATRRTPRGNGGSQRHRLQGLAGRLLQFKFFFCREYYVVSEYIKSIPFLEKGTFPEREFTHTKPHAKSQFL